MSWRTIIISNNAKLDYQMGYLVVRGQETRKIYINEIATIVIESTAVSMTAYLLCELTKNKVKIIFCDEKRNPVSELVPYYGSHDASMKIRSQVKWNDETKRIVWTEIVRDKIRKQAALLKKRGAAEEKILREYEKEVVVGDTTNREGHAAKVYFNALFGKTFSRSEDCPTNAALNYGYSILLSMFNREIVTNGYITQLGIFHDNMFNQFNLASDFMESFRPLIDEIVLEMNPLVFEKEQKHELLSVLQTEVMIDGRMEYIPNAIRIYTRSLFDAINERDISLIKFYVI